MINVIYAYGIFFGTLILDIVVYFDKLKIFNNVYTDNLIKLYFVFLIVTTLFYYLAFMGIQNHLVKTISDEKALKAYKSLNSLRFKIFKTIEILTVLGFGVIGCWWFFSVLVLQNVFEFSFIYFLKKQIKIIIEKSPELKKQFEKKVKVKTKLNFLTK